MARRLALCLILVCVIPALLRADPSCISNPNICTAASAERSDVLAAINASVANGRNGTVNVPAGSSSTAWPSAITLTKGIKIIGAGRDLTTVTTTTGAFTITPDATAIANEEIILVNGFTFDGGGATSTMFSINGANEYGCAGAITSCSPAKPFRNLVIGSNRIKNMNTPSGTTGAIVGAGQFRGVIYGNIFDRCNLILNLNGVNHIAEWSNSIYVPFAYGSADNLFFENNLIQFSSSYTGADHGMTYVSQGSRCVMRYNTWNYQNSTADGWREIHDNHGFQHCTALGTCGEDGLMLAEYYGNTYNGFYGFSWMNHRGSWMLMFNNVAANGASSPDIRIDQYDLSCEGGSGCDAVSGITGGQVNNTYVWNNTANGARKNMGACTDANCNNGGNCVGQGCGTAENVSYWNYNASPTPATSGVFTGTDAPTLAANNGSAYWQASTPGPTTDSAVIQAGHLWKRIGGVWIDYYRPYTYPHPLRGINNATPSPAPSGTPSPTPTPTATATVVPSPTVTPSPGIISPILESSAGGMRMTSGDGNVLHTQYWPQRLARGDVAIIAGAIWGAPATTGLTIRSFPHHGSLFNYNVILGPVLPSTIRTFVAWRKITQGDETGFSLTIANQDNQTFQFSFSGTVFKYVQGADVDGGSTTGTIASGSGTASDAITPSEKALVIGVMAHNASNDRTLTAGSGWTTFGENENQATSISHHAVYKIVTTSQSYTSSVDIGTGGGSCPWTMQTYSFAPVPGEYVTSSPAPFHPSPLWP